MEDQGEHRADEGAPDDDEEDRAADGQGQWNRVGGVGKADHREQDHGEDAHESKDGAEDEACQKFFFDDPPPEPKMDLFDGDGAHKQTGGLGSGVAARSNDERDEECKDHGLFELMIKEPDDADAQELEDEEPGEPGAAFANHVADRRGGVGCVEGFHAAEFLDIFGELFFGDIGDVVGGDDADEEAERINDGQGGAVITSHRADGLFAVVGGAQGDELVVHQVGDGGVRLGQEDRADVEVVDECAVGVDDEYPVDDFGVLAVAADVVECVCDGPFFAEADIVGGHESPDGFGVVAEDDLGDGAVFWAHACDERGGDFYGEFVEEGGAVIGFEVFDDSCGALAAEDVEQRLLNREFELCKYI